MSKLRRRLLILLLVFLCAILAFDFEFYKVYNINPWQLEVNYIRLKDSKIPDSMVNTSIVYISDLEYGEFVHPGHLENVFDKINELNPDILLFGGDLFAQDYTLSAAAIDQVTRWLSSVEAPLGKFAVYGEQDLISSIRKDYVDKIYLESQVEVMSNTSLLLTNQSTDGIKLVGLDLDADYTEAFRTADASTFNLVFTHYPDNLAASAMQNLPVGYALAGNAHGTQITWPFYGGYRIWKGSQNLNRAHLLSLNFDYSLASGLGCININARLNAKPDLYYFLITR